MLQLLKLQQILFKNAATFKIAACPLSVGHRNMVSNVFGMGRSTNSIA